MKHDEKWLGNNDPEEKGYTGLVDGFSDFERYARDYHQHMTRWRGMDEVPEKNERIEVARIVGSPNGKAKISSIEYFSGRFEPRAYAWRPVGELPEVSDVA